MHAKARLVFVINSAPNISLVLINAFAGPDFNEGMLEWFVNELKVGIEALQKEEICASSPKSSLDKNPLPDMFKNLIKQTLKQLLEHSQCKGAIFLFSRMSFKVAKKDKSTSQFRLKKLVRMLNLGVLDEKCVEAKIDSAMNRALKFLSGGVAREMPLLEVDQALAIFGFL